MKSRLNNILIIIVIIMTSLSFADPVSPVGKGTSPINTGTIRGLQRSPNPMNSAGNDVITGNISGDKYFRGSVPYSSSTNFSASSGSTSLDSFLRRSASSSDYNYQSGTYKPYYSSSGSITTIRPGRTKVFTAPRADFSGINPQGTVATDDLPKINNVSPRTQLYGKPVRPLEMSYEEIQQTIDMDVSRGYYDLHVDETKMKKQAKEFHEQLQETKNKLQELEAKLQKHKTDELDKFKQQEIDKSKLEPENLETQTETEMLASKIVNNEKLDIYDQMRIQIVGLDQMVKARQKINEKKTASMEERLEEATKDPSPEKIVVEAMTYKTLAAYKNDKFNKYMRLAENYLKDAKYYSAINAYSLAEIYKPEDPVIYMGKCQALFASGEYMSSAYNLLLAFEIFPEIINAKIDIVAIIGDKDLVESRASTVEQYIKDFDRVELRYLLSYVYSQTGRLERAKELIDEAYETNPDLPIVQSIKAMIEQALN